LARGKRGFEPYAADDHSLGLFPRPRSYPRELSPPSRAGFAHRVARASLLVAIAAVILFV
jgi:hypothetical protein